MIALRHACGLAYASENGELTIVATQPHATLRYAAASCCARRRWLAREAGGAPLDAGSGRAAGPRGMS
jgi:hypothetical protein